MNHDRKSELWHSGSQKGLKWDKGAYSRRYGLNWNIERRNRRYWNQEFNPDRERDESITTDKNML